MNRFLMKIMSKINNVSYILYVLLLINDIKQKDYKIHFHQLTEKYSCIDCISKSSDIWAPG